MSYEKKHGWATCPKAGVALLICILLGVLFANVLTGLIIGIILGLFLHYGTCRR